MLHRLNLSKQIKLKTTNKNKPQIIKGHTHQEWPKHEPTTQKITPHPHTNIL